jgi:hypothetical protein
MQGDVCGTECRVVLHFRPRHAGSVNSAKGVQRDRDYSASVVEDVALPRFAARLAELAQRCPQFNEAVLTLRVWALSHGLVPADSLAEAGSVAALIADGLNLFALCSAVLLRLYEDGTINSGSTSDVMLRAAWVLLSRMDLNWPELIVPSEPHLNVWHRVGLGAVAGVRRAATHALTTGANSDGVTTDGIDMLERLDIAVRVGCKTRGAHIALDKFGTDAATAAAAFRATLVTALGERAASVYVSFIRVNVPGAAATYDVLVGLEWSEEAQARSRLFRGPPLEDTAGCAAFDALWGKGKAASRQFNEGGIFRCVMWPAVHADALSEFADPAHTPRMAAQVVEWLLSVHVGAITQPACAIAGTEALAMLQEADATGVMADAEPSVVTLRAKAAEETKELVMAAASDSLPSGVSAIDFVSPSARGTDAFGVVPHMALLGAAAKRPAVVSTSGSVTPVFAVITIEDKRRRVPDQLDAIRAMKGAVVGQLVKTLESKPAVRALVTGTADPLGPFLDVVHAASGVLFRFTISHFREISLLRSMGREGPANALERAQCWSAQHAQYIHNCFNETPVMVGAVRLMRRWVSAMGMADYLTPEAVELIVVAAFSRRTRAGRSAVQSAAAGFLAALRLLATFPFAEHPLLLPLCDPTVPSATWAKIRKEAAADCEGAPHLMPGMFIAAPYCAAERSPFTDGTPRRGVLARLQACADAALRACRQCAHTAASAADWSAVVAGAFTTAADCFDVVVPLTEAAANLSARRAISCTPPVAQLRRVPCVHGLTDAAASTLVAALAERDPVAAAVRAVRRELREACMVFVDDVAPASIGVVILGHRKQGDGERLDSIAALVAKHAGAAIAVGPPPKPEPTEEEIASADADAAAAPVVSKKGGDKRPAGAPAKMAQKKPPQRQQQQKEHGKPEQPRPVSGAGKRRARE